MLGSLWNQITVLLFVSEVHVRKGLPIPVHKLYSLAVLGVALRCVRGEQKIEPDVLCRYHGS